MSDQDPSTVLSGEPPSVPDSDTFPWRALPLHLQEQILCRLPVSTLLRFLTVCRHFLSLFRSPPFLSLVASHLPHRLDAFFLLSPTLAYHPFTSRFVSIPLPVPTHPIASSPSLLITHSAAVRPFSVSASSHPIPPITAAVLTPYVLTVFHDPSDSGHFTLVAVSTEGDVRSQVFDSRIGQWTPRGEIPILFAFLGNVVHLGRHLFVLGRCPDKILSFEPETGQWCVLDTALPGDIASAHLFVFKKGLFLVGGVETFGVVVRIAVWAMDWERREWREISAMPKVLFAKFMAHPAPFYHFQAADRMGLVCLYNAADSRLVMFDAAEMAWSRLQRPHGVSAEDSMWWFGHVVEPSIDLLMPPTS